MGVNKKTDGRYIVGMGAPNENEYKGSMGWRDIFIQLTENGATPDSEEKLAFLRDYAIYHNGEGNAIMPPSVSVWVSNNGVTSAVNADDITLEDGTYTICGIKWDGSSWDYTNAGQSSGGGGGSSLPSYTSSDVGKVLTVVEDSEHPTQHTVIPEQTATLEKTAGDVWLYLFDENSGVDTDFFENASVGDKCFISIDGAEYVESTAVAVYDMVLFPAGDYYVGYASTFGGMGVASLSESPKTNITITAYANVNGQLAEWRTGVLIININPYFITPSSDYYPALKAAYDDGAKLFARVIGMSSDIDSHSAGALSAVSYDSANDQFKARISYLQDGSVLYMAVGDVTIFNDNTNFTVSDVCKVQMTRV